MSLLNAVLLRNYFTFYIGRPYPAGNKDPVHEEQLN